MEEHSDRYITAFDNGLLDITGIQHETNKKERKNLIKASHKK